MRTFAVSSPGFNALANMLEPDVEMEAPFEARVALVTSKGQTMTSDTFAHLDGVCSVDHRPFPVSAADADRKLASLLRELSTATPRFDAVLLVRGGGEQPDLQRLASEGVIREVEALRDRGILVVAAFGHGNQHVDIHADIHATTPTAGAQIIRARFHDLPTQQRRVIAEHITQASQLVLNGRVDSSYLATGLAASLTNVAAEHQAFVQRHEQIVESDISSPQP